MYRNGRGNNARAVSEKLSTIDSSLPDLSPLPAPNDKAIATGAKDHHVCRIKLKATVENASRKLDGDRYPKGPAR
jgi:hypothetical protein